MTVGRKQSQEPTRPEHSGGILLPEGGIAILDMQRPHQTLVPDLLCVRSSTVSAGDVTKSVFKTAK